MEEAIRILVVDDEPDIRRICRILLETGGYTVLEAATGADSPDPPPTSCAGSRYAPSQYCLTPAYTSRARPSRRSCAPARRGPGSPPAAGADGDGVFHSPLPGGEPGPRRAGAHDL